MKYKKYINKEGKVIIDNKSLGIMVSDPFRCGFAKIIAEGKGRYNNHFMNTSGEIVLNRDNKKIKTGFYNGLALGEEGFFDSKGDLIVPVKWRNNHTKMNINGIVYSNVSDRYQNELLLVCKLVKGILRFGYLNKSGDLQINFSTYGMARSFSGGYSVVTEYFTKKEGTPPDSIASIINTKNEKVFEFPLESDDNKIHLTIGYNVDQYMVYSSDEDNCIRIIDIEKGTTINTQIKTWRKDYYDFGWRNDTIFSEGLAKVKINRRYGMINTLGDMVIEPVYKDLGHCREGLIPAKLDKKWGYINKKSEWVIGEKYKNATPFSDTLALVTP